MNKLVMAAALAAGSAWGAAVDLHFNETTVVRGGDVSAEFAVKELNEIVKKCTGREFAVVMPKKGADPVKAKHRIFVGRSEESERILGKEFLDSLADEESVVREKGGDLFLVGGGQLGALYAVYDFVEDNLGYRWYFKRPDGEVYRRCGAVSFNGRDTRRKPSFVGKRQQHSAFWAKDELYVLRNRGNQSNVVKPFVPAYRDPFEQQVGVHSLYTYLPPFKPFEIRARKKGVPYKDQKVLLSYGPYFKDHPEYYTLSADGKRIAGNPNSNGEAQLCLSNPEVRDLLYTNLKKIYKVKGGGLYKIDSQDRHNSRYCYCPGCVALEKKYNSVGGPLWDTVLYVCDRLEKDGIKDVYIGSLAYKGPDQTERAPDNIVFPKNFVVDEAFLIWDRSVSEAHTERMKDGTLYNKFENLKKWRKITTWRSWWYYGSASPYIGHRRVAKELRELYHDGGVQSPGSCGYDGGQEFDDMIPYIWYYVMRDVDADVDAIFREMCRVKYGAAGEIVFRYACELEEARAAAVKELPALAPSFIKPELIVRWQRSFDEAVKLVADDPEALFHTRVARESLDLWTLQFSSRIRKACPDWTFDVKEVMDRCRKATEAYWARKVRPPHWKNRVERELNAYAHYPDLKDESLPEPLRKYDPEKVVRFLPPLRFKAWTQYGDNKYSSWEDKDAVAGWAWMDELWDAAFTKKGEMVFHLHSESDKKWLWPGGVNVPLKDFEKGKYKLFCLGKANIRPTNEFVLGNTWGSPLGLKILNSLYDPTYDAKLWELWVSVKIEGPRCFPGDTGKDRLWCDVVYAVDCGVPEGK